LVCINNSSTSLKITAYVTLCGCYGYQPLWHPMQCRPDLAATVIVRGRHSIETLPCKLGPIIVSVHHLPHLPVIVALDRTNGWDEWRRRRRRKEDRHNRRDRKDGVPYLFVQLSPHSVLGLHLSWALLGSDNGPS